MEPLHLAECCVIGSIFLDRQAWIEASRLMDSGMFSNPAHATIWDGIAAMYAEGHPVDEVTLPDFLRRRGVFDRIGGYGHFSECIRSVPTSTNVAYYADIVRSAWVKREARRVGAGLAEASEAFEFDIGTSATKAREELDRLTRAASPSAPVTLAEAAGGMVTDALAGREQDRGLSTGFPTLDAKLGGFQRGNLILLAARTSIGKTSLALNIAAHVALTLGKRVIVFSLEMSAGEVVRSITANVGNVNLFQAQGRKLTGDEAAHLTGAALKLSSRNLILRCAGHQTVSSIAADAQAAHIAEPLALIVVDYIGLVEGERGVRHENAQSRISAVSRGLKALAMDLGVPVLALAQLNRDADKADRAPLLHDLRDSGALEQDANTVLLLHRKLADERQVPAPTSLSVAKARVMPRNTVIPLDFYGQYFRFVESGFRQEDRE